jgi:hypothetical protein
LEQGEGLKCKTYKEDWTAGWFLKKAGVICKTGIFLDFWICFCIEKVVNQVFGPVDPVELGPWSTSHHGRPLVLAGAWPWAAPGTGGLHRQHGKVEGRPGIITGSEVQWRGEPIEPATGQCYGGGRYTVRVVLGARTRGEWAGDECGEVGASSSPFYRGSGWSGGIRAGRGSAGGGGDGHE